MEDAGVLAPSVSRLNISNALPIEIWTWIIRKFVSDRIKRCAPLQEILKLRLVSRKFDDITLFCLFGPGGEKAITTARQKIPFLNAQGTETEPYSEINVDIYRLFGYELTSKFIYYQNFISAEPTSYIWKTILQMVAKVEPEPSMQERFLRQVLDLLVWNRGISHMNYMLCNNPTPKKRVDEDKSLWEFSFILLKGDLREIQNFLPRVSDLNKNSKVFGPYLLAAVFSEQYKAVELLIKSGVGGAPIFSSLSRACAVGNLELAKLLLESEHNKSLDSVHYSGRSWGWDPLAICCKLGRLEMVQLLLNPLSHSIASKSQLTVDSENRVVTIWANDMARGQAVGEAISRGHMDIVSTLMERRLHLVHACPFLGIRNPVYEIFRHGKKEILNQLLAWGYRQLIVTEPMALLGAASGGQLEMAQWLADNKYSFRDHVHAEARLYALASWNGNLRMLEFLESKTFTTTYHEMPTHDRLEFDRASLDAAIYRDRSDIVNYMLQQGANPNGSGNVMYACHPLTTACKHGAINCVRLLLKHGVDLKKRRGVDFPSPPPIEIAYHNGFDSIVRLLLEAGAETTRKEILLLRPNKP